MILIEVPANPNCGGCEQIAFNETDGAIRQIRDIVVSTSSGDADCEAVSVNSDGTFGPAFARKIDDSGEGPAFLVFGGEWGIRFRRKTDAARSWSLSDPSQWGEPYKVYGMNGDIRF